jgi:hypothetical protein
MANNCSCMSERAIDLPIAMLRGGTQPGSTTSAVQMNLCVIGSVNTVVGPWNADRGCVAVCGSGGTVVWIPRASGHGGTIVIGVFWMLCNDVVKMLLHTAYDTLTHLW